MQITKAMKDISVMIHNGLKLSGTKTAEPLYIIDRDILEGILCLHEFDNLYTKKLPEEPLKAIKLIRLLTGQH